MRHGRSTSPGGHESWTIEPLRSIAESALTSPDSIAIPMPLGSAECTHLRGSPDQVTLTYKLAGPPERSNFWSDQRGGFPSLPVATTVEGSVLVLRCAQNVNGSRASGAIHTAAELIDQALTDIYISVTLTGILAGPRDPQPPG